MPLGDLLEAPKTLLTAFNEDVLKPPKEIPKALVVLPHALHRTLKDP